MERLKDFVSSNLNPFLPLAKYIYKVALGRIMHTEVNQCLISGIGRQQLPQEWTCKSQA